MYQSLNFSIKNFVFSNLEMQLIPEKNTAVN